MTEPQANEALEKLNRGIQESRQAAQRQTIGLAQDYFVDSVEALKKQIRESRDTLEDLPDQVPGGRDEAFQMLFQELMDNYAAIEQAIEESQGNVSGLDLESLERQGAANASDAARQKARELGVDISEIEGTGSEGRIVVDDVKDFAESAEETVDETVEDAVDEAADVADEATDQASGAAQEVKNIKASDAAKRKAEELGVDLSQVEGSGSEGGITVKDVTAFAGQAGGAASGAVEEVAAQANGSVGDAADTATEAVSGVAGGAGEAAEQAAETAGEAADGATDEVVGTVDEVAEGAPKVTNAAKRKAEELGVDLSTVKGSGANGLITIKDVVNA